jgi:GT2 family glycosyltransferase/tetratricopeptide (TPR) repeat protein
MSFLCMGEREQADLVRRQAETARDQGRWSEAAELFDTHTSMRPKRVGSWIQLGNMRKQAGEHQAAERAYRQAIAVRPNVEAWSQLGHLLLAQGRNGDAVEALKAALDLNPIHRVAREGLIAAGARSLLPLGGGDWNTLNRLRNISKEIDDAIAAAVDASIVPLAFYDQFSRAEALPMPPETPSVPVHVLIDGRGVSPDRLRASLLSLVDQTLDTWTAVVTLDASLASHPVASLALIDPRIRFSDDLASIGGGAFLVTTAAGVVFRPTALSWLVFGAVRTRRSVVYSDHDHFVEGWPQGETRADPVFFSAPDVHDLRTIPDLPIAVLWKQGCAPSASDDETLREALVAAAQNGEAVNVPLVLASVKRLSPQARVGLPSLDEAAAGHLEAVRPPSPACVASSFDDTPIRVVIPTRDACGMLAACIDSLLDKARLPDRVRITIMDNRSVEADTRQFLHEGRARGRFSVMTVDEAFNWARINNLAVEASVEPNLLFLNNDTEVLTQGWDDRISTYLAQDDVGLVGARLLYPDRTLQHGGVVLGLGSGTPRHEGLGALEGDGGPNARWLRTRSVAAVTGAFLAVRRETHQRLSGFDQLNFAIGYNDIDYCLRARRQRLKVLYAADIEAIHYESRTRGLNDTRGRMAWDLAELMTLKRLWGEEMTRDPAVNPHWMTGSARPFDGIQAVSADQAAAWLDQVGGGR